MCPSRNFKNSFRRRATDHRPICRKAQSSVYNNADDHCACVCAWSSADGGQDGLLRAAECPSSSGTYRQHHGARISLHSSLRRDVDHPRSAGTAHQHLTSRLQRRRSPRTPNSGSFCRVETNGTGSGLSFAFSAYCMCRTPSKRRTDGQTENTHDNNVHRDRRRHAVSMSLRLVTNGRTVRAANYIRGVRPSVRPSLRWSLTL